MSQPTDAGNASEHATGSSVRTKRLPFACLILGGAILGALLAVPATRAESTPFQGRSEDQTGTVHRFRILGQVVYEEAVRLDQQGSFDSVSRFIRWGLSAAFALVGAGLGAAVGMAEGGPIRRRH